MTSIWNMLQSLDIHAAKADASMANLKSVRNQTDLEYLETRIDTLVLVCQALAELSYRKH
ncbi:MAG: hypothetical protein V3W04_11600 [Gammaproteobacteria bacterium]